MIKLLVTRPRHEITTNYLYYFAGEVIKQVKNKIKIYDLSDRRANCQEFESIINKTKPGIIFLNGHGNDENVGGINNETILGIDKNEQITAKTIIYALSCSSAKTLGKSCVDKGARSYIGYNDVFVFSYEESKISKPLQDETAKQFLGPSNTLILSLLKGHTAKYSHERSKAHFAANIKNLLTSTSPQTDKTYIPWLIWDMNCQVCIGDGEAKVNWGTFL